MGFINLLDIFPRDLQAFSFIFGVIVCVGSIVSGIVILVFTYFLAELINLLTDMASNLKKIETTVSTEESPEETYGDYSKIRKYIYSSSVNKTHRRWRGVFDRGVFDRAFPLAWVFLWISLLTSPHYSV